MISIQKSELMNLKKKKGEPQWVESVQNNKIIELIFWSPKIIIESVKTK